METFSVKLSDDDSVLTTKFVKDSEREWVDFDLEQYLGAHGPQWYTLTVGSFSLTLFQPGSQVNKSSR